MDTVNLNQNKKGIYIDVILLKFFSEYGRKDVWNLFVLQNGIEYSTAARDGLKTFWVETETKTET